MTPVYEAGPLPCDIEASYPLMNSALLGLVPQFKAPGIEWTSRMAEYLLLSPLGLRAEASDAGSLGALRLGADTSADINTLSQRYIREYINSSFPQFENDFVSSARENTIESGHIYEFEDIFEAHRKKGSIAAAKMLSRLLQKYYGDAHIVKAILHTVSHYSYSELGEDFVFEAASLCHHENKGIKKFALKVFDNWDAIETLDMLKHTEPIREKWLEEYRQEIIKHLEQLKGERANAISYSGYQSRKLA